MKYVKLTERQRRLVKAYVKTGNATEAARIAGYSEKTANRIGPENLSKPVIQEAIKKLLKKIEEAQTATPEEVMRFLSASMRGQITEEVVVVEGTGEGCSDARVIEKQISARDRLEAAKQLLKRYPRQVEAEAEQLKVDKLRAEVEALKENDSEEVVIIDDVPDEETK